MTIEDLLPGPGDAPRCSDFATAIGLSPAGTAIRADQVLVADVPLPWPSPVKSHPQLDGLMDVVGTAPVPSRLLAAVPSDPDAGLVVRRFVRSGPSAVRSDYRAGASEFGTLVGLIAAGSDQADAYAIGEGPAATVLICTQGSHDLCCGTDGTRLFDTVRDRYPGVEVIRVSHLGGHRFAPTAFTFPDGRMWARLDEQMLDRIVSRRGPAPAAHCRGWWGADRGPAQVAEAELFGRMGWALDDTERSVHVLDEEDGLTTVLISTGDLRFVVDVAVSREVPTIACRAGGGLPYKPALEWRVIG